MRILFLAPNPPSSKTGGGSIRMLHLVRFLGQRFPLDLVAPALPGMEEAESLLRNVCSSMVFVPPRPSYPWRRFVRLGPYETDPSLASTIHSRLATQGYSAVQVEKPAMLPYLPKDLRTRSEEHTSELQSRLHLVCRLLLEKK